MRAGSLAHESIIAILHRRFVSTFFDIYPGPAYDEAGAAFAEQQEDSLNYGAICTPDGEVIVTFGFNPVEVYLAMLYALRAHPEFGQPTPEEKETLRGATEGAERIPALLTAAVLAGELLEFDRARVWLDQVLELDPSREDRNRALYLCGRTHLLDIGNFDPDACRADFDRIVDPSPSLAADIALDRIMLDTHPRAHIFFGGWTFREGVDVTAIKERLRHLIATQPKHRRIGEMHFLLGLACAELGRLDEAKKIWADHVRRWPDDRTAMLSHLHSPTYDFSPLHGSGFIGGNSPGGFGNDVPMLIRRLGQLGVDVRDTRDLLTPGQESVDGVSMPTTAPSNDK